MLGWSCRNSWVVCKIKSVAPWNSHPRGCNVMSFLYRLLVFYVWLLHATEHPPSLQCGYTLSLKPNPSCLLHYYVFSLGVVKLSMHFPCYFSFLHLLFSTLRCLLSEPPWGVVTSESPWGFLRALFGLILCIHYIAFTPGSPQLGFYFSKHSLWHLHRLFSHGLHRNTSVTATIFPSNALYGLACLLLFLQALVPPPRHALHVPSRLLNSTFFILSQGSSALRTSTSTPCFLFPVLS